MKIGGEREKLLQLEK